MNTLYLLNSYSKMELLPDLMHDSYAAPLSPVQRTEKNFYALCPMMAEGNQMLLEGVDVGEIWEGGNQNTYPRQRLCQKAIFGTG